MSVNLSLSYVQSNDAKTIRFTDTVGEYSGSNTSGWGAPNEEIADIVVLTDTTAAKYHLVLEISITTSDGTVTEYDPIDLVAAFPDQFLLTSGMVYDIIGSHFAVNSGEALSDEDELPDGLWEVTYKLTNADDEATVVETTYSSFMVGTVTKKVANALLTAVYGAERGINQENWGELKRALIKATYLKGMNSYPSISKINRKLNILATLENYTIDD